MSEMEAIQKAKDIVGKTIRNVVVEETRNDPPRHYWVIEFTDDSKVFLQCDDPYCFITIEPSLETEFIKGA